MKSNKKGFLFIDLGILIIFLFSIYFLFLSLGGQKSNKGASSGHVVKGLHKVCQTYEDTNFFLPINLRSQKERLYCVSQKDIDKYSLVEYKYLYENSSNIISGQEDSKFFSKLDITEISLSELQELVSKTNMSISILPEEELKKVTEEYLKLTDLEKQYGPQAIPDTRLGVLQLEDTFLVLIPQERKLEYKYKTNKKKYITITSLKTEPIKPLEITLSK